MSYYNILFDGTERIIYCPTTSTHRSNFLNKKEALKAIDYQCSKFGTNRNEFQIIKITKEIESFEDIQLKNERIITI